MDVAWATLSRRRLHARIALQRLNGPRPARRSSGPPEQHQPRPTGDRQTHRLSFRRRSQTARRPRPHVVVPACAEATPITYKKKPAWREYIPNARQYSSGPLAKMLERGVATLVVDVFKRRWSGFRAATRSVAGPASEGDQPVSFNNDVFQTCMMSLSLLCVMICVFAWTVSVQCAPSDTRRISDLRDITACRLPWVGTGHVCVKFSRETATALQAEKACVDQNAELCTLHWQDEVNLLLNMTRHNGREYYVGRYRYPGGPHWMPKNAPMNSLRTTSSPITVHGDQNAVGYAYLRGNTLTSAEDGGTKYRSYVCCWNSCVGDARPVPGGRARSLRCEVHRSEDGQRGTSSRGTIDGL